MPWNTGHLTSTLHWARRKGAPDRSSAQNIEITKNPEATNEEIWHQGVRTSYEILTYLKNGGPRVEITHLSALRDITTRYLRELDSVPVSTVLDECLRDLISQHKSEPYTGDVAVIACFHALSKQAAIFHLSSLFDLEVSRYLRCILVCQQVNRRLFSEREVGTAQSLEKLLCGGDQCLQGFQQFIEISALDHKPMSCISLSTVHKALVKSGIQTRIEQRLHFGLENHQYIGLFGLFSWLEYVPRLTEHSDVVGFLNEYFPAWSWLMKWRPNRDRISRWQYGKFTEVQRMKLSGAFALDGPDVATCKEGSLRLAVPHCFEHIVVEPQTTEMLEKFLGFLYKASTIGRSATDLFIYLCIDQIANDGSFKKLDVYLKEMNDSYCGGLLSTLGAIKSHSQSDLSTQITSLTNALSSFGDTRTCPSSHVFETSISGHLNDVMEAAQREFCTQIETGTGDYIGMLIYNLGKAILRVPSLHSYISPEIISRLRGYPPQDAVEAIFDQLEDLENTPDIDNVRLKSYLASFLGGRGDLSGPIELSTIQNEVQFWKRRPDSTRKGLARTLARIRSLDYHSYTSALVVMLKEDDQFILHMKNMIILEYESSCLEFALYLAHRRKLRQLQHDCWLLILVSLVREFGASFLPSVARRMRIDEWVDISRMFTNLLTPIFSKLPCTGVGITQELLSWWKTLSENKITVDYLQERQNGQGNLAWLYFPRSVSETQEFLDLVRHRDTLSPVCLQILSYLAFDGNNIAVVCGCLKAYRESTKLGFAVVERIFDRIMKRSLWSDSALSLVLHNWKQSASLVARDRVALGYIKTLLLLPNRPSQEMNTSISRSVIEALQIEYIALLSNARNLEVLRLKFHRREAQKLSIMLRRLDIDNSSSGGTIDEEIPPDLIDSVSIVGRREYELSFALTGLSELQRQAKGIPNDARLLLVRLSLCNGPKFCIHFAPNDEGGTSHIYWKPDATYSVPSSICTTKSNVLIYYLSSQLCKIFGATSNEISLDYVHSIILKIITLSPTSCLYCTGPMNVKLWKPASCSKSCSLGLRCAPLEVRLHNLLVDPLTIDLLLTCVYATAADTSSLKLLPGCPVLKSDIQKVINSFPPLTKLQTAQNLQAAVRGNDVYGKAREDLLSWLCLSFRGFMLLAPDGFRIPSMPNTIQFLLLNSHHEREHLFRQKKAVLGGSSGPVFHGTNILRLFLILSQGLKTVSNTRFMAHGAAMGPGVYCADDQSTSRPYSGSTGQSWRHSMLSNMNIILGCELAGYSPSNVHLISDHDQLLVRYVFLLPPGYNPPPRHHVDQAMNSVFAKLHSGVLT